MGWFASLLLLFVVCNDAFFVMATGKDDWYQRYDEYPEYCSTPEQMENRKIPPFPDDNKDIGETRLIHVAAVLRHGARTPKGLQNCWSTYYTNPSTSVWDCDLTSVESPFTVVGGNTMEFHKHYDALVQDDSNGISNVLNGTCQNGQLILQGYDQVFTNGRFLRDAYVYNQKTKQNHDVRMRLIDTTAATSDNPKKIPDQPWHESNIYFRSDDMPRTILSGQVLLRSMLQEEITLFYDREAANAKKNSGSGNMARTKVSMKVHTSDLTRDYLRMEQEESCPRLAFMRSRILQSEELRKFNSSGEARTLRRFMRNELKTRYEINMMECLLPTVCTDRDLPQVIVERGLSFPNETTNKLVDYQKSEHDTKFRRYGSHIFYRMMDFAIRREVQIFQTKNARYSKLAMGPLWSDIMDNVKPIVTKGEDAPVKFALYSGHDSTIVGLLSALGPKMWKEDEWPTYAGMVLLEIHELVDGQSNKQVYKSKYAFRIIYNGESITDRLDGCIHELCDANVLLKALTYVHRSTCYWRRHEVLSLAGKLEDDISSEANFFGMFTFVVVILCSIAAGSLGMYIHLMKIKAKAEYTMKGIYNRPLGSEEEEDIAAGYDIDGLMLSSNNTPYSDDPPLADGPGDEHNVQLTS